MKYITSIQADIIFKALYYTALKEGVDIPEELTKVYEVLAENNPNDTDVANTVEVMEYLVDFIKDCEIYSYYFKEEID